LFGSKIIRSIGTLRKKLMEKTFRYNILSILDLKLNHIRTIPTWPNQLVYILCEKHIICKIILIQWDVFSLKIMLPHIIILYFFEPLLFSYLLVVLIFIIYWEKNKNLGSFICLILSNIFNFPNKALLIELMFAVEAIFLG